MTTDSGIPAGQDSAAGPLRVGSPLEVLAVFTRLGVSSFGGPIAHLGYFRDELVTRRRWVDDSAYADLVALCQFLPGPASSQVGFALGLLRGGWLGGIAAWVGFTLPSAIAMVLFAFGAGRLGGPIGAGVMHGLKLVAVAIVAQAVWGMARSLCPDRPRAAICLVAIAVIAVAGGSLGQIAAIVLGGALGLVLCRNAADATFGHLPAPPVSRAAGAILLALFMALLIVPPLVVATWQSQALAMFDAFYRSGALVFGGGHVVLPLLRAAVVPPGWVADDAFLAGYGAAQALPGPLFTFGAYLGAVMRPPPNGVLGAALALVAIALPGLLLVAGALPFWDAFRRRRGAQAAMRGTNAAVVGILATALYDPVWTTAVLSLRDFTLAAFGFVLLLVWRAPPLAVVVAIALASAALAALSR